MKTKVNKYNVILSVGTQMGYSSEVITHEYNMLKNTGTHSPKADHRLKVVTRRVLNNRFSKNKTGAYSLV